MEYKERSTEFEEKLITINRITKVTKGGRRLRFSALVIVGDRNGRVGFGTGKGREVTDAIKKGGEAARKNVFKIPRLNTTVPHLVVANYGASRVIIKPAPVGSGIIAGGAARGVFELAGITDVSCKALGSRTKINMVRAVFAGLNILHTKEHLLVNRGLLKKEQVVELPDFTEELEAEGNENE
jgi:small subunit ribosomal protein S5